MRKVQAYETVIGVEAAYAAGLFDGEGCVHIAPYVKRGRDYHRLYVILTNTYLPVLKWAQSRWGGYLQQVEATTLRHRVAFHLRFTEGYAEPFLKCILPYLIIKKAQAQIGLAFIAAKSANRHGRLGDAAAVSKRADLYDQLQPYVRGRRKVATAFAPPETSHVPEREGGRLGRLPGENHFLILADPGAIAGAPIDLISLTRQISDAAVPAPQDSP